MNDADLLRLHRDLVATPSVSRDEGRAAALVAEVLRAAGVEPILLDRNVAAVVGPAGAPTLHLCSHLDTVPPTSAWTRAPWTPIVEDGRVYGLGSNDAKAAVAAMIAAFVRLAAAPPLRVVLLFTAEEEVGGKGAEAALPELAQRGLAPDAALVGEPTSLDLAIAQKGLMVCELRASTGRTVHAAHARALGARNPIRDLAVDLLATESVDFGPADADLGPVTVEPTVLTGGTARNLVPPEAACVLDVRVNPSPTPEETAARLRAAVRRGELRVLSDRLRPRATPADAAIVRACRAARPGARTFGSRGVSDWCFYGDVPTVKVGPGLTDRSHTPDEWIDAAEIPAAAAFYEKAARAYATERAATDAARRSAGAAR